MLFEAGAGSAWGGRAGTLAPGNRIDLDQFQSGGIQGWRHLTSTDA
jgi:hypothetical protein